jgi:hypothetical protein
MNMAAAAFRRYGPTERLGFLFTLQPGSQQRSLISVVGQKQKAK